MSFDFATAARIRFGPGAVREVAPAARLMGTHALVVTGRDMRPAAALVAELHAVSVAATPFSIAGEPTIERVDEGIATARRAGCDLVIASGGGSAIDAGKAIAAIVANSGEILDYLEVVGRGRPLEKPSLPLIAIPTTAGTGSEVTRNAVLASPGHGVKASLRGAGMLPRMAVVDPELTLTLPPAVTASTGLDALTQLVEPFVTPRANEMTDLYCREGMARVARSLERAYTHGNNLAARTDMALASLFGGLALANAGLGAVHGLAAPLGGAYPAPHGAVCAALLPHVVDVNLRALRLRAPSSPALARYSEIARIFGCDNLAARLAELCQALNVAPLATFGVPREAFPRIAAQAARASSMKANPVELGEAELVEILERAS
jgi:alcohol dehydrogenase class IV